MINKKTTPTPNILTEEREKSCRLCDNLAMCNQFTCYKEKQGTADCASCEERLCQLHWRIYFRNNI